MLSHTLSDVLHTTAPCGRQSRYCPTWQRSPTSPRPTTKLWGQVFQVFSWKASGPCIMLGWYVTLEGIQEIPRNRYSGNVRVPKTTLRVSDSLEGLTEPRGAVINRACFRKGRAKSRRQRPPAGLSQGRQAVLASPGNNIWQHEWRNTANEGAHPSL